MTFSFLIRCINNAQRWKYAISTGYFHLIRICPIFLQISQKWCRSKAKKAWYFGMRKNDYCRLYNERARALQSFITFFFDTPCTGWVKKKLMPFQIQISREFHYGTLSIPIGIQRTDRDYKYTVEDE